MYVDHLFVEEKYRGQDFGSLLLAKVEEIAREHGANLIHLDTFDFQAQDFYIKHGKALAFQNGALIAKYLLAS